MVFPGFLGCSVCWLRCVFEGCGCYSVLLVGFRCDSRCRFGLVLGVILVRRDGWVSGNFGVLWLVLVCF